MSPAISAALIQPGISHNLLCEIREGPIVGGIVGVLSFFHYQGTSKTTMLVDQIARGTPCGKVISVVHTDLCGTWVWITCRDMIFTTCQYNYENNIKIDVKYSTLESKQQGDHSIMQVATQCFN